MVERLRFIQLNMHIVVISEMIFDDRLVFLYVIRTSLSGYNVIWFYFKQNNFFMLLILETSTLCINVDFMIEFAFFCRPKSGSSVWNPFKGDASLSAAAGELRWEEHSQKEQWSWKFGAWRTWQDSLPSARPQTFPLKAALSTKTVSGTSAAASGFRGQPSELASRLASHLLTMWLLETDGLQLLTLSEWEDLYRQTMFPAIPALFVIFTALLL